MPTHAKVMEELLERAFTETDIVSLPALGNKYGACSKTDKLCPVVVFTPDLSLDICFGNEHLLRLAIIL